MGGAMQTIDLCNSTVIEQSGDRRRLIAACNFSCRYITQTFGLYYTCIVGLMMTVGDCSYTVLLHHTYTQITQLKSQNVSE